MSSQEAQQEELEVLRSIYEGDGNFKEISPTIFHYKYGEDGNYKSFILELSWPDSYPEEPPCVNMQMFYNKHILEKVKQKIINDILNQVQDLLGSAMTYTLFEWVRENLDDLLADQPDAPPLLEQAEARDHETVVNQDEGKKKEKKEQFSKSQKRKMFDRMTNAATGEKPRGWDWVDIVKHLSQSGNQ
ncbi:hypothetical protein ACJMK2_011492 [Sinanodonta woodiana]|uniref:RWD domain-containing protein n=1 Tax=Sinanodonta woodiana TaxID=1069815 RepID=A0ABD3V7K9_SINWO